LDAVGFAGGLLVLVVIASFRTSTAKVILDDVGVRWDGSGSEGGQLPWDAIRGLDYDHKARILIVGLVDKHAGRFYPLPFINKELYLALKARLGSIPDVEGECLLK
jgi:hypothetical protein